MTNDETNGWGDSTVATAYVYERIHDILNITEPEEVSYAGLCSLYSSRLSRFSDELANNFYVDTGVKIGEHFGWEKSKPRLETVKNDKMYNTHITLVPGGDAGEEFEGYLTEDDFSGIIFLVIAELLRRGFCSPYPPPTYSNTGVPIQLDYSLELLDDDQLVQIMEKLDLPNSAMFGGFMADEKPKPWTKAKP